MTRFDRSAWVGDALERYERPLLRYVQSITRDAEAARDVVQETFLKLCKADAAELDGRQAAWLYTVARNHALNVVRKEGRMDPLTDERTATLAAPSAGPHDAAAANERQARVVAMLETLPQEQREACRLKFQDGLTYREISQVMGVSLGKVNNLIAAALLSMRAQLKAGDLLAREF